MLKTLLNHLYTFTKIHRYKMIRLWLEFRFLLYLLMFQAPGLAAAELCAADVVRVAG